MVSNGGDYSRKRKHSSATANVHQRLGSRPQFSSRSCGRSSSRANLSTGQRTVGRSRQRNQSRLKHSNLKKDFSLKNSKRENVKLNEETAGTSIIQRIRGYSQTSAGTSPTKLKSTHEISFVEGTVVEVQQTYGFIFVDSSTAALEVLSLTKETKGRMKFELPSSKSAVTARKFKVNDHVTFSVNVFDLTNLRLDGQAKYEITNVILRFSRTDEQIYTSTIVNSRKRKIENEIASSSTECSDAKRSKNSSAKIQIAGKIVTWSCNEETDSMFCFVKPIDKLPDGIFKERNFYLHLSNLAALGLALAPGDVVEIVVNPNIAKKMRADRGILTKLSHTVHSDVNEVLQGTLTFLEKCTSDLIYYASQLYETRPVLALFQFLLTRKTLTLSEEMDCLFVIIKVLQLCSTRSGTKFFREVLTYAMASGLFDRNGFFFKLFTSHIYTQEALELSNHFFTGLTSNIQSSFQTAPMNLQQVLKLVQICVETYPDCSRKIHNLIVCKESVCSRGILLELLRVLSRPYAKMEDLCYREVKLVPSDEEIQQFILNEKGHFNISNLRPVIQKGAYESADNYIQTYFNLLRFDCFYNFLKGLKHYVEGKHDSRDMSVYKKGSLLAIGLDKLSAAISFTVGLRLETKTAAEKVKSERYFMYGNLVGVFLSESAICDPIWTTVGNKERELKDGCLRVSLIFSKDANSKSFLECFQTLVQNSGDFLLVESPTYYHAYWPVLRALQDLRPDDLPFQEELVQGKLVDVNDGYLSDESSCYEVVLDSDDDCQEFDQKDSSTLSCRYRSLAAKQNKHWNSEYSCGGMALDPSQIGAMNLVLDHRIAIVQGPPGTGKTFLGVQVVDALLNRRYCDGSPIVRGPILVLTYKNHALDEFSKHIVTKVLKTSKSNEFIRVGGRSKEEEMKKYSLKAAMEKSGKIENELNKKLDEVSKELLEEVEDFSETCSVLEIEVLKRHLTVAQIGVLIEEFVKLQSQQSEFIEEFQYLNYHFKGLHKMASILYELLDKSDDKPAMDRLERLFTAAIRAWIPEDESLSQCIENERKKLATQPNFSFTDLSTANIEEDSETTEVENIRGVEELEQEAEERQEISINVTREATPSQRMTRIRRKHDDIKMALRHHGVLTNLFAARVDLKDFRLMSSLFRMSPVERFQFLQAMLVKQCELSSHKAKFSFEQFEACATQAKRLSLSREIEVLKKAKLVAMTITGAAIRNEILNMVKPSVIIVEEAAEINEAHLISLLGNHVEHLILIGDHKQLRPQVECYKLEKQYNFDVSMMERLINNKLPYATLNYQNRMRPDISKYLTDIYPDLKDSDRVHDNPEVIGLEKNCFFWHHENHEKSGRSPLNEVEARAAIDLTEYLCDFMGYSVERVTILAGYKGQTALLRRMAQKFNTKDKRVDVQTIDMFQGDENDVVIVSTTRSNSKNNPGFMAKLNRRCVAQSRGKSGVYFIGNGKTLSAVPPDESSRNSDLTWSPFLEALRKDGCYGDEMIVACKNHKEVTKRLKVGDSFPSSSNLLCERKCFVKHNCGIHRCQRNCQPYHDKDHTTCKQIVTFDFNCGKHSSTKECHVDRKSLICKNSCEFEFHNASSCDIEVHRCTKTCEPSHEHDKCYTEIHFFCEKGHPLRRYCWENADTIRCYKLLTYVFPSCGRHESIRKCYEGPETKVCSNVCNIKLNCSHLCKRLCKETHSHDPNENRCEELIKFQHRCQQTLTRMCWQSEQSILCENRCVKKLECEHRCPLLCDPEHNHQCNPLIICREKVEDHCTKCGNSLWRECSERVDSSKCTSLVDFKHWCGFQMWKPCNLPNQAVVCEGKCTISLACGHPCDKTCGVKHCHDYPCLKIITFNCQSCSQNLQRLCSQNESDVQCTGSMKRSCPKCNRGSEGPCVQSGQTFKCQLPCDKKLACEHTCSQQCFEDCLVSKCKVCIKAQKEKERLESMRLEEQKNREIEAVRAQTRKELQNIPSDRKSTRVLQQKIDAGSDDAFKFFQLADMVKKYIKAENGYQAKINSVFTISNLNAKEKYFQAKLKLKDPTIEKRLCYFTAESRKKVEDLCEYGFYKRFSHQGRKPYQRFSKSMRCLTFATQSKKVSFKKNFYFTVLICDVLVGRAKTVKSQSEIPESAKDVDSRFDSIFYYPNSERQSSHVIYKPSHVVVTDRVEFSLEREKSQNYRDLRNGRFQKIVLELPKRDLSFNDKKQEYCNMALARYFDGCRDTRKSIKDIERIELFLNPDLEKNFEKKLAEFERKYAGEKKYCQQIMTFHGTDFHDLDSIMKENFRLDKIKRTAFGYGVYFSEYVSTSLSYARNTGQLILAKVLLGKSEVSSNCPNMRRGELDTSGDILCTEHDSHTVQPTSDEGHAKMVIIQNVDQILPMFTIRIKKLSLQT